MLLTDLKTLPLQTTTRAESLTGNDSLDGAMDRIGSTTSVPTGGTDNSATDSLFCASSIFDNTNKGNEPIQLIFGHKYHWEHRWPITD